jgi:F-type H+-transporting ATPase subunit b
MTPRKLSTVCAAIAAFALTSMGPLSIALASPPHAEEAGHGAGHGAEGHATGIKWLGDGFLGGPGADGRTGFLIILINFVVLMMILNKILFRNLKLANAEKSDTIRLELERATRARSEAESLVQQYETKLAALEAEVASIRAAANASAEAERARIIADAHEQANTIKLAAERAAEREATRFRVEIEREIVEQAMARAEASIRASFGPADQRRLVDAWVDEVSATTIGGTN